MKKKHFLWLSLPMISILAIATAACDAKKTREQEIIGEWKAHWETSLEEGMPALSEDNLKMNGLIIFRPDGKVDISAFGYEGCIFSDDTLTNTLHWKLDDTVLRFIDSGGDQGLPYTIMKFTNEELQLTLLEDINLTLQREN